MGDETRITRYQYDPLYQLTNVLKSDGNETGYTYDPVGNRLEMMKKAGETVARTKYTYNQANELLSLIKDGDEGLTTFDYDGNGSLLMETRPGSRITSYSYDFANRLVRVDLPQDKFVAYGYDGDGNRIAKISSKSPDKDQKENGKGQEKDKSNNGKGPDKDKKPEKQNAVNSIKILSNGNGGGNSGGNGGGDGGNGGGSSDNGGGNGGGNAGSNDNGNSGNNGNHGNGNNGNGNDSSKGNDGEKSNNGNGPGKDKSNNGKGADKEKELNGKGYKGKGKYENKGKHKGWYKNGKYAEWLKNELNPELLETTYYVNDAANPLTQVLMTYDDQDNYKATYAYGLERIENTRPESQDPLYYLYDGLGSVAQLVRPNGEVRDHYRYNEFGVPAPGAKLSEDGRNVNHNTFGYTGELWDEEDDLLYLRSRYYQPETGKFLNRDTYKGILQNPLSRHLYNYVGNNPINLIDPLGHLWLKRGDQGVEVEIVRWLLGEAGYPVKMDNNVENDSTEIQTFNEEMEIQVNNFKNDKNLWNTGKYRGIVGDTTFELLVFHAYQKGYSIEQIDEKPIVYTDKMNNLNPWFSVRLVKENIKILMDAIAPEISRINDALEMLGTGSEGAGQLPGNLQKWGQIYTVVTGLTLEAVLETQKKQLETIKQDLQYYYNNADVSSIGIIFESYWDDYVIIGSSKRNLWASGGLLYSLIRDNFDVKDAKC